MINCELYFPPIKVDILFLTQFPSGFVPKLFCKMFAKLFNEIFPNFRKKLRAALTTHSHGVECYIDLCTSSARLKIK